MKTFKELKRTLAEAIEEVNGGKLLQRKKYNPKNPADDHISVVLVQRDKEHHPFVTWIEREENGRKQYSSGNYFADLDNAAKDFKKRGLKEGTIVEATKAFVKANVKDNDGITTGGYPTSYAIKIDSLERNDFPTQPFGRRIDDMKKVKEFQAKAKKDYIGTKHKATMPEVKKWIAAVKPSEYYARWTSDSSSHKTDVVEIWYTGGNIKSVQEDAKFDGNDRYSDVGMNRDGEHYVTYTDKKTKQGGSEIVKSKDEGIAKAKKFVAGAPYKFDKIHGILVKEEWTVQNTEPDVWFERDRAHVGLRTKDGKDIFDLWDEDVADAIESGFLTKPRHPRPSERDWHQHLVDYANERGLGSKLMKEDAPASDEPQLIADMRKSLDEGDMAKIKFKEGGSLKIDMQTANMLLTIYGALKKDTAKADFVERLQRSKAWFMKLVDWGWKQVK